VVAKHLDEAERHAQVNHDLQDRVLHLEAQNAALLAELAVLKQAADLIQHIKDRISYCGHGSIYVTCGLCMAGPLVQNGFAPPRF
jgi:hypothetical protein